MAQQNQQNNPWTEQHLKCWEDTIYTIRSVLSKYSHVHDLAGTIEDTRQETFIRAHERMGTFDAEQGDFGAWIRQIARRCAYDHLRSLGAHQRSEEAMENEIFPQDLEDLTALEAILAEAENDQRIQDLATVLRIAATVLGDTEPVARVLALILAHEPFSFRLTAEELGVAEDTLRRSTTKVLMYTEVIYRALKIYRNRCEMGTQQQAVPMQDVISCLPQSRLNSQPHYTHCVTLATLDAGHVDNIDVSELAARCSWTYAYTARCISTTTQLFNLALAIIQNGDI